jgi:hypothetical protein
MLGFWNYMEKYGGNIMDGILCSTTEHKLTRCKGSCPLRRAPWHLFPPLNLLVPCPKRKSPITIFGCQLRHSSNLLYRLREEPNNIQYHPIFNLPIIQLCTANTPIIWVASLYSWSASARSSNVNTLFRTLQTCSEKQHEASLVQRWVMIYWNWPCRLFQVYITTSAYLLSR